MQTYPMAVISEPGKIVFEDHALYDLQPDEVRIKVKYAAICGSDLHLFKGLHPSVELPSAVGHELSGEIVEIGPAVTHLKVGDRVTVEPVIACGKCHFCLRGQYHLCQDVSFHYRRGQGAFGAYFSAPARYVFRLPDSKPAPWWSRFPSRCTRSTSAKCALASPLPSLAPARSACW